MAVSHRCRSAREVYSQMTCVFRQWLSKCVKRKFKDAHGNRPVGASCLHHLKQFWLKQVIRAEQNQQEIIQICAHLIQGQSCIGQLLEKKQCNTYFLTRWGSHTVISFRKPACCCLLAHYVEHQEWVPGC